jgi:hypothetical protein
MKYFYRYIKPFAIAPMLVALGGCTYAPSIDIDGSFLPSWMLCLLVGFAVAGTIHWQLVVRNLQHKVMPVVVFYPSVVIATSCLVWLLFYR